MLAWMDGWIDGCMHVGICTYIHACTDTYMCVCACCCPVCHVCHRPFAQGRGVATGRSPLLSPAPTEPLFGMCGYMCACIC